MKVGFIGLGAMGAPMACRVVRAGFEVYTTIHRRREAAEHLATLFEVIKESSGYSKMMDLRLAGFLLEGTFRPGFKLDLMRKDINLAMDSARAEGVPLFVTAAVAQVFAAASAAGEGDADFSAAAQFLADLANVKLAQPRQPGPTSGTASTR
jgi:3-hydroxyisobutyrate dehydrogenase-like beta-hydroxyacid dehydrogenase